MKSIQSIDQRRKKYFPGGHVKLREFSGMLKSRQGSGKDKSSGAKPA